MRLDPATPEELKQVTATIDQWAAEALQSPDSPLVAVDYDEESRRWFLRMHGEDKAVITCWVTLNERTLGWECQFMPSPEENVEGCYGYLLRRASRLGGLSFVIGDEDAVYITGQMPVEHVTDDELDRFLGSFWEWTEACFATAMSIGFGSRYRRPR